MTKRNYRIPILVVLVLLTISLPMNSCIRKDSQENIQWQINAASQGFTSLWSRSDNSIYLNEKPFGTRMQYRIFMLAQNDRLIFFENGTLKSLDLGTGETIWQMRHGRASGVAYNEHYIFLGREHENAQHRLGTMIKAGSISLVAYEIDTGQQKWSNTFEGIAFIDTLSADEAVISINGHNGHGAYPAVLNINASGGELLGVGEPLVEKINRRSTPDLHWLDERKDIVSDIVIEHGVAYFLASSGTLWAVDVESGSELGYVSLAPTDSSALPLVAYGIPGYQIVAKDGFVVLFFWEEQQLFVFRFLR
jgi:outer membrane protein assembly factor BamB